MDLPSYPCAKLKLDQFFLQWLSEHQDLVNNLLEDAQAGKPLRGPATAMGGPSPLSPATQHAIFAMTPPLSPSKPRSPRSPLSPARKSSTSSSLKRPPLSQLPQFYFPNGATAPDSARLEFQGRVDHHFNAHPIGLGMEEFVGMAFDAGDLPRMIGRCMFRRLAGEAGTHVPKDAFTKWWAAHNMLSAPPIKRVYEVLRKEGQEYLTYEDFSPLMDMVLKYHPGLEFLAETAEFQKKYAETVVFRIFYALNKAGSGQLTLRELRRGDLLEALEALDSEDDINKVLKYFSYEHFYVIYCKFWELDSDHDFLIDRSDLAHYSQCALSFNIIDRVFEQVPRKFASRVPGKMSYEDFVWFILSEEDKTTDTALEYWFKCVDLDSDGVIRPREMWTFYEEQLKRLEGLSAEPVLFPDVVCQLHDMLQPAQEGEYTLRDLKRTKPQSALLFNALFNLHKFLSYENRDPFAMRAEQGEFAGLTEWDKFAKVEYYRLASEDDHEDVTMEAEEQWQDAPMLDSMDRRPAGGKD
uniref:EF-hand domain-containing protein n=1 Tax=Chlamydomonas leiostraca TaxID=1034604 RepID=A0A7S0S199_9CHLO|mmetsp:Transcript_37430/g.94462  ORF Transcript_37430/g.94462 Transcript_37430/m.94462 type:complete len:524 (+) Transcript_37430:294-1865(+)